VCPLPRPDAEETARDLCTRWRATSLQVGWAFPADWWVPAVDAVAAALCDGRDPAAPCTLLGRARAEAAVGLDEALIDLAALYAAFTDSDPPGGSAGQAGQAPSYGVPGHLVRAVAVGWAEATSDPAAGGCEDPLTGLVVPAYLRVRLGEVYREGKRSGLPVPATHAFVVAEVDLTGGESLTQLSRLVLLADCLRTTFPGGETLCGVGPGRALALVRRDGGLSAWANALRHLLSVELDPFTERPARVWVEGLPGTLPAAHRLVAELAR
jgi:hypothetical protein